MGVEQRLHCALSDKQAFENRVAVLSKDLEYRSAVQDSLEEIRKFVSTGTTSTQSSIGIITKVIQSQIASSVVPITSSGEGLKLKVN